MILNANALHIPLADESADCCVTSPPYWGLRDYGTGGQLGLESTPEEYTANMVAVFRDVWRVLKPEGTLWLNLGDSYNGSGGEHKDGSGQGGIGAKDRWRVGDGIGQKNIHNLKPKDLVGIPWRVAFALQADGWYLRSDIIWHKPNPMPESVTDRPTKSHEYIFLLTKSARYYYDQNAILEPTTGYDGRKDTKFKGSTKYKDSGQTFAERGHERWRYKNLQPDGQQPNTMHIKRTEGEEYLSPVRNKRSVWTVPTRSYTGAHFATYPPALIEPCILAGCPMGGIVLDPFFGSGTTGEVAIKNSRRFIGLELNREYINLAKQRVSNVNVVLF